MATDSEQPTPSAQYPARTPGTPSPREVSREAGVAGKSLRFGLSWLEQALLSSGPVALVGSPAALFLICAMGSRAPTRLGGCAGEAQRPRQGRPSWPGSAGSLRARPPVGSAHRRNASCRGVQEAPALEEGSCVMEKLCGERCSTFGDICTESGIGHRAGPGVAEACSASAANSASSLCSPCSPCSRSLQRSMAARLLSGRVARGRPTIASALTPRPEQRRRKRRARGSPSGERAPPRLRLPAGCRPGSCFRRPPNEAKAGRVRAGPEQTLFHPQRGAGERIRAGRRAGAPAARRVRAPAGGSRASPGPRAAATVGNGRLRTPRVPAPNARGPGRRAVYLLQSLGFSITVTQLQ